MDSALNDLVSLVLLITILLIAMSVASHPMHGKGAFHLPGKFWRWMIFTTRRMIGGVLQEITNIIKPGKKKR